MTPLDVLAIGAHPDDIEVGIGATLALFVARGLRVGALDLTRGEHGSRGTPEARALEAAAASKVIGLAQREQLGLPDARLTPDVECREKLARCLRELRPALVLCPHAIDPHPDHVAASALTHDACFAAGVTQLAPELEPHRPRLVLSYSLTLGAFAPNPEPTLIVPIKPEQFEVKLEAVRCYASQLTPNPIAANDLRGRVTGPTLLDRIAVRARELGNRVGAPYGEALFADRPLACVDPFDLIRGVVE